mgnify:CR=1 FL=1
MRVPVHFFADNNVRYKIIINGYYFSEIVSIDCSLNAIQRHLQFHSIIKFALSQSKIKIVAFIHGVIFDGYLDNE